MRVLIVDDEPLSRNALKNAVCERKDVEVFHWAADAVEALEMLEEKSYDVLLLDIQMPELSGIELADRLNKRRGAIPAIIFLTAHDQHAVAAFEKHAVRFSRFQFPLNFTLAFFQRRMGRDIEEYEIEGAYKIWKPAVRGFQSVCLNKSA